MLHMRMKLRGWGVILQMEDEAAVCVWEGGGGELGVL